MNEKELINYNPSELKYLAKNQKKNNLFNFLSSKNKYWIWEIIKLLIELVVITIVVFTLIFILFNLVPGEPKIITDAREKGDENAILALQDFFRVGSNYGFFSRYFFSISGFFNGTLGYSWTTAQQISTFFWSRLSISVSIGLISMGFSAMIGIPFGIFLARRETTYSDILASIGSVLAFSIPSFAIALVLVGLNTVLGLPTVFEFGNIYVYLLSAVVIAIPVGFGYSRYLRSSIRKEYREQYVSLARIKGISENKILSKHIFKPALFPIVNYLPFVIIGSLFGSITIELVFSIPGTGQMLIDAAIEHDQNSLLVVTTFYTLFVVFSFFVRDLLIKFIDPRIRES